RKAPLHVRGRNSCAIPGGTLADVEPGRWTPLPGPAAENLVVPATGQRGLSRSADRPATSARSNCTTTSEPGRLRAAGRNGRGRGGVSVRARFGPFGPNRTRPLHV